MGIQGLLPLLKSIMTPIHVKELEGRWVAVDTYSWLHKGALSCSTELCKGQPTSRHIDYCMHRVNMLSYYGVKPILVFDGGHLPMKHDQEIKRARSRKENLACAIEHESNGNLTAAYECYQKAVDISPSVAYDLIQVLKQKNVSYLVAPYEADAQMTFLALSKQVEAVITEDSDLIAFGCPRILYKMDKFGQAVEFKNSMLPKNKELDLTGFTQMMLLEMCILSGCDYLQSLPGLGLKKAYNLMKKFKNHEKVIKHLKYNGVEIPPLYEESFWKAIMTFKHQRVYDPTIEDIVLLSETVYHNNDNLDFLGPSVPQHVAKGIAHGDLDPFTKTPIQQECGAADSTLRESCTLKTYKPRCERRHLDLPVQKNLLTNYFCLASLEAKRKFRAPRRTSKHPKRSNENSRPRMDMQEVNPQAKTEKSMFLEASECGLWNDRYLDHNEMQSLTNPKDSLCKPSRSLHMGIDSDGKDGKSSSGNSSVIVRSHYFQNKSRLKEEEDGTDITKKRDVKFEYSSSKHAYELLSDLSEGKCRKQEARVALGSSYFMKDAASCEREEMAMGCDVDTSRIDIGASNYKVTFEKFLYSDQEDEREGSGTKHATQRCSKFRRKSIKENKENEAYIQQRWKNNLEDVISQYAYKPLHASSEVKCRQDDKRNIMESSYFLHKHAKEVGTSEVEKTITEYPDKTCEFELDDIDARNTDDDKEDLAKISYLHNKEKPESRNITIGDDVACHTVENNILRSPRNNSMEYVAKKRKIVEVDVQEKRIDVARMTGTCTTDLDRGKTDNGMLSSNVAHLNQYSDIAEKSMERFISVISSFRYTPSRRCVSGLRAPLRDLKRNTGMEE